MGYYSAIKRNEFVSYSRWMNLDPVIHSKVNKKEKNIAYLYTHTHTHMNSRKVVLTNPVENRLVDTEGESAGAMN